MEAHAHEEAFQGCEGGSDGFGIVKRAGRASASRTAEKAFVGGEDTDVEGPEGADGARLRSFVQGTMRFNEDGGGAEGKPVVQGDAASRTRGILFIGIAAVTVA